MNNIKKMLSVITICLLCGCSNSTPAEDAESNKTPEVVEVNHIELLNKAKENLKKMKSVTIEYTGEGVDGSTEVLYKNMNTKDEEMYMDLTDYGSGNVVNYWCRDGKGYLRIHPTSGNKVTYMNQESCMVDPIVTVEVINEFELERYEKKDGYIVYKLDTSDSKYFKDFYFSVNNKTGQIEQLQSKVTTDSMCNDSKCSYLDVKMYLSDHNNTVFSSMDYKWFNENAKPIK